MLLVGPPVPAITYVASRASHVGGNMLPVGPPVQQAVTYVASRVSHTGGNICC
jgi:hypothetical protein